MIHDTCDNCGSETWDEGHFAVGKLWCAECWSGRKPPLAMPPTPAQKQQIDLWIATRPPAQQTLRLDELAQPGVQHG